MIPDLLFPLVPLIIGLVLMIIKFDNVLLAAIILILIRDCSIWKESYVMGV